MSSWWLKQNDGSLDVRRVLKRLTAPAITANIFLYVHSDQRALTRWSSNCKMSRDPYQDCLFSKIPLGRYISIRLFFQTSQYQYQCLPQKSSTGWVKLLLLQCKHKDTKPVKTDGQHTPQSPHSVSHLLSAIFFECPKGEILALHGASTHPHDETKK